MYNNNSLPDGAKYIKGGAISLSPPKQYTPVIDKELALKKLAELEAEAKYWKDVLKDE